jgi:hypothetical protein
MLLEIYYHKLNICMKTGLNCLVLLLCLTMASCAIVYSSEDGVLKINQKRFFLKGASWFGF